MTSIQVLEELTLLQPFGLRFWDQVTQSVVSDGLVVTAWRSAQPEVRTLAWLNRSGVFSFRNLPGLREIENGAGDADFWAQHAPQFSPQFDFAKSRVFTHAAIATFRCTAVRAGAIRCSMRRAGEFPWSPRRTPDRWNTWTRHITNWCRTG